ncbi:MAG: CvpA family protein [Candidatus Syntrophonatronum acetioxidans]|uniref:CvpA family protein n=1 Tax=Candidatus Syntrophonatronum acetioxidans TaxID=1795816 RepID=A0A424YGW5_9FIRM|nr:MAG: CvpA family protein [Candidatus Syntrophonatronum acetioxidans]
MNWLDVILALVLLFSGLKGFRRGLVLQVVDLAGFIISWYLAIRWGPQLGQQLDDYFNISRFLQFEGNGALEFIPLGEYIVIFIGVITLLIITSLIFSLTGRFINTLTFLPLLKPINSLMGTPLGLIKGLLFVFIIIILLKLSPHPFIIQAGENSFFFAFLDQSVSLVMEWGLELLLERVASGSL